MDSTHQLDLGCSRERSGFTTVNPKKYKIFNRGDKLGGRYATHSLQYCKFVQPFSRSTVQSFNCSLYSSNSIQCHKFPRWSRRNERDFSREYPKMLGISFRKELPTIHTTSIFSVFSLKRTHYSEPRRCFFQPTRTSLSQYMCYS